MPKRKLEASKILETDPCVLLQPIIELFGTPGILFSIIDGEKKDKIPFEIVLKENRKVTVFNENQEYILKPIYYEVINGLQYANSHWHAYKEGKSTDSYTLDFQIKQSAHFCQTFALLIQR